MAVNPKSMSGQDTLSMHLRAFTERIPPTGSLREMSGDSDLLVHPVHVRYRIKPILLYPDYSYISYRSIRKPSVGQNGNFSSTGACEKKRHSGLGGQSGSKLRTASGGRNPFWDT